jgi:trk system potassium uptake protein TrkA
MSDKAIKPRRIAVMGLGAFGATVAMELARFGNRVLGIDIDEARVTRHAERLDGP